MNISTKVFLGFAIIIFTSIAGYMIQYQLSREVVRNMGFVTNSEDVIRNSTALHRSVIEMQAALRGYLLTDDTLFLGPYYEGRQTIPKLIEEQQRLLQNSPTQLKTLDTIHILHSFWTEYAGSLLSSKKESFQTDIGKHRFKEIFDMKLRKRVGMTMVKNIKLKFLAFDKTEYQKRAVRREALKKSIRFSNSSSIFIIVANICIALLIGYFILKAISGRISGMVMWAEEISKGNFITKTDDKKDELSRLSISLNTVSKQLNESFTELREKNKDLDQFAYATSHDLKAPLRGMYNILTWIEEDLGKTLPEQLTLYHEKLKGRIIRLEQIINGLLEYARISRKEQIWEDVNIHEMLLNLADLLIPPHFKLDISNKISTIKTEKVLLQQVLTNLISNAVKFQNKPGEECIIIQCEEKKDHYLFSVTDNGVGISKEYFEKIFGLFQTLRDKNDSEDTGIGLAIVKKVVEERKGKVTVKSQQGIGSTFTITWPKAKEYKI